MNSVLAREGDTFLAFYWRQQFIAISSFYGTFCAFFPLNVSICVGRRELVRLNSQPEPTMKILLSVSLSRQDRAMVFESHSMRHNYRIERNSYLRRRCVCL